MRRAADGAGLRTGVSALLALLGVAWVAWLPSTVGAAETRPAAEEWAYRIAPGDTLIGLHATLLRPDADWRVVQRLNRIADPRRLVPGRLLRIPVALLREEPVRAEVVYAHGEVWLERDGGPRQALAAAAAVVDGDTVVTGAQSSAVLRFADGGRTLIGPGSRLRIDRHARLGSGATRTRLRLDAGGAESQVPPASPSPSFELRTPAVNLGVRGTEFRSRVDGMRTWAEVTQGRVAAGSRALEAGFGTVATPAGVAPPRALAPAPDLAAVPALIERIPLQVPIAASGAAGRWRAQVYATGEDRRLLLDGVFEQPLAAWTDDLPDGRYELRVRASDADGLEGLAASAPFTLKARPEPPFLRQPRAGERLTDDAITLAWARQPAAARYRLQVAADPAFASPLLARDDVEGTELRVTVPVGSYRWRVGSITAGGDIGPWGSASTFERAEKPPPPPAPSPQPPRKSDQGIVLAWSASPITGATYQVQIARDAAFTDLVVDERTGSTETVLRDPEPGTYRVRVRTIGPDGRPGAFGGAQEVEVPRSWWWLWFVPLLLLL